MSDPMRELSAATGEMDGLHINEDGSVVAIAGETLVVVPLSTDEMRKFAAMLQSAAAHIDKVQKTSRGGRR